MTKNNTGLILILPLTIVDVLRLQALKLISQDVFRCKSAQVNHRGIDWQLSLCSICPKDLRDPDLIIRTSGEAFEQFPSVSEDYSGSFRVYMA